MKVEKNKVVSVGYSLRTEENGPIIEQTAEEKPLTFLFGRGMMLQKFEENLEGLSEGESTKFHLTSQEGYGEYDENMVVNLPIKVFQDKDGNLNTEICKVGNHIPMQDNKGNHLIGKILHIFDNAVKVDFNHDMAGKDLFFEVTIKKIRDAEKEEIEHGHVHHEGHCCHHGEKGEGHCCHKHEEGGEHHCCHNHEHEEEGGEHHCCHNHDK